MKIQFENPDKVNGLLTMTIEESDYKETVEKQLKDFRKKANYPGFRPGMVPMGLIKKQYGVSAKAEAVNKVISDNLFKYMQDNNIKMLGQALPSEKQKPQDLVNDTTHTFIFDIAVAPDFEVKLTGNDKVPYYNITVDDALIDRQVDMFASRSGSYEKAEVFDANQNDILKGDLRELLSLEAPIEQEGVTIMPSYISADDQKKLFDGAKLGDIITFNPRKAYGDAELAAILKCDKADLGKHCGDFTYQITEISRYAKHPVDKELFDQVYGKDSCADEKAFREKIAEGVAQQLKSDSDYKFLQDCRAHIEKKIGKLTWPDALLKRIMLDGNKDKGEDFIEKNYDQSIKQLTWHLIKEQLVAKYQIKIEDADIKQTAIEAAKVQFAQYGMNNVPEEYLENYAQEMLKKQESIEGLVDRAIDVKLTAALKDAVKLDEKSISLDDFNKLMEEK